MSGRYSVGGCSSGLGWPLRGVPLYNNSAYTVQCMYSVYTTSFINPLICIVHVLYLQCRALHKQLNHNSTLRVKLAQDLQVASDTIQQLQVCLEKCRTPAKSLQLYLAAS